MQIGSKRGNAQGRLKQVGLETQTIFRAVKRSPALLTARRQLPISLASLWMVGPRLCMAFSIV